MIPTPIIVRAGEVFIAVPATPSLIRPDTDAGDDAL